MADDTPSSDHGSPAGKLNNAISDFASSYVKKELLQLTRERDDALARSHVPKLRALLREVDKERHAFEQDKEKLIYGLREKLALLEVDADTIEATIAELNPMGPKYLSVIPGASTLTIRPPTPLMSPVRDNYFHTVLGADILSSDTPFAAQIPGREILGQGIPNVVKEHCSSSMNINVSSTPNIVCEISSQNISENSRFSQATKRTSTDDDGTPSTKKPRTEDGRTLSRTQSDIFRKVAFPNLVTSERIFRHSERQGLFVIRCNRSKCSSGYFTEPPLAYNRALKHFQGHGETGPDGEELTNEYIFENFACEIEGINMVSKYWIKEHLGSSPHTFSPGKPRSRNGQVDKVEDVDDVDDVKIDTNEPLRKRQDDKNYTPSKKIQNHVPTHEPDDEVEAEKPRRTPRSVQRPDYAEMVANKDPWNLSDEESERAIPRSMKGSKGFMKAANATAKSSRSSSSRSQGSSNTSSKTSTPVPSTSRAKTTPSKPFGYTSEQWPRRSAPS